MMRQSLQAVLPEISGNKTSLLRKSVCSDLLTLLILLIRHYRHYLFQACLSGKCITRATNISRAGIAVSCVLHCYFMSHGLRRCRLILKRTATLWRSALR